MKFNSNQDLRDFAMTLSTELERNGEDELANEFKLWNKDIFTSPSEFLGELMLILEKVNLTSNLSDMQKQQIAECLTVIKNSLA